MIFTKIEQIFFLFYLKTFLVCFAFYLNAKQTGHIFKKKRISGVDLMKRGVKYELR